MDPATLNNMAIVSIEGAARLGRVRDVLFETSPLRVAALLARDDSGETIVRFDQISNIGSDAVMVETANVSEHSSQPAGQLRGLADVLALKVVDEEGAYVGTVKTLDFDPAGGTVDRLVAQAGGSGVLGIGAGDTTTVEASDVRSVGTDLITVSTRRTSSDTN